MIPSLKYYREFFCFTELSSIQPPTASVRTTSKRSKLRSDLRENVNPYFEIPNYLRSGPLVILDPTQFLIKNIAQNAYQIPDIQREFAIAALHIQRTKDKFFEELHREMKEQGGVKKDYFLSYHKKKDRVLDMSKNLIEDILYLRKPMQMVDQAPLDIH
jgi:hypothetical protein